MFPLSRLPLLAMEEVFRCMEPKELFFLSLLSKRTKLRIQLSMPTNSVPVSFENKYRFAVSISDFKMRFSSNSINYSQDRVFKIRTETVCFSEEYKNCHWVASDRSFHYNHERFVMTIIGHFEDIFNNPAVKLVCKDYFEEDLTFELIRHFKKQNKKLKVCIDSNVSAEVYKAILDECSSIEELHMDSLLPQTFEYRPSSVFKTKKLTVAGSFHWVHLEDFLQCRDVEIHNCFTQDNAKLARENVESFYEKIVSTDSKIEKFFLSCWGVKGITRETMPETKVDIVTRKDGKKLRMGVQAGCYIIINA